MHPDVHTHAPRHTHTQLPRLPHFCSYSFQVRLRSCNIQVSLFASEQQTWKDHQDPGSQVCHVTLAFHHAVVVLHPLLLTPPRGKSLFPILERRLDTSHRLPGNSDLLEIAANPSGIFTRAGGHVHLNPVGGATRREATWRTGAGREEQGV